MVRVFGYYNFFCQTTTESYGSYGLSLIFQLLNRASFIKKKNIKDYKDHFCMEITPPPPPEKKGTVSFGPAIVFVYSANRIISYTTFYVSNVKTDFGKIS